MSNLNNISKRIIILFIDLGLIFAPMDAWLILPIDIVGVKISISRVLVLFSFFIYITLSIKKRYISFNSMLILVFFWSIVYMLSIFWIDISIEKSLIFRKLFSLIFSILLIYLGYLSEKYDQTIRVFAIIITISVIVALVEQIYGIRPQIERQHLFLYELTAFYINPAHLGATLALLSPWIKYYISKRNIKLIEYILDFIILFIIIRTGSKGAILAFLIGLFIMLFSIKDLRKNFLLNIIIYILIGIFLYYFILYFTLIPDIILNKINLLFRTSAASESYIGRTEIYEVMFSYIKNRPLLGYGLGTSSYLGMSSHNFWLEIWFEGGIINFIIFIFIYFTTLYNLLFIKTDVGSKLCLAFLIAFIPISFTVSSIFTLWSFWIVLGVCFYRINSKCNFDIYKN